MGAIWTALMTFLALLALWAFSLPPKPHGDALGGVEPTRLHIDAVALSEDDLQIATRVRPGKHAGTVSVRFMPLMRTGERDNAEVYGGLKDRADRLLRHEDGRPYLCNPVDGVPGSGLDYVSILNDPDGSGRLYMVSQFECPIGAYYLNELLQDADGGITPKKGSLRFVSQKSYHGGWTHCAGSKTPWESHLGSEEYEADGRTIERYRRADGSTGFEGFDETAKFFGGDAGEANPYYWGWVTEVKVEEAEPVYKKHYAMGRFSHELAYVMPDGRTVYMSDDGSNTGFYMFVADHEANLNSGTLYAARWEQKSRNNGGSAAISWVNLGHASASEVRRAVDAGVRFSELFETEEPTEDHTCPTEGFHPVNTSGRTECLKVRTDRYGESVISRLESRRYAALKGATTEFRKEEGITYDPEHRRLYVAMSSLTHGMLSADATFDAGGPDHIRLEANGCGAVYALPVGDGRPEDSDGVRIESDYVVGSMRALVSGLPSNDGTCDTNGIANPDNLSYMAGWNTLLIGEDSNKHVNNVLWAYDVESGALQRLALLPGGAEATSVYWHGDIGGYGYVGLTVQHPDDGNGSAYHGVIGPFPQPSD